MCIDGAPFSHAMLYLGDNTILESAIGGVRPFDCNILFFENINNFCLLRYSDPEISKLAAKKAGSSANKFYSLWGAIVSVLKGRLHTSDSSIFCSKLVAKSYAEAGVDVCDTEDVSKATPKALYKSTKLNTISPLPVVRISIENQEQYISYNSHKNRKNFYKKSKVLEENRISKLTYIVIRFFYINESVKKGNLLDCIVNLHKIKKYKIKTVQKIILLILNYLNYFDLPDEIDQNIQKKDELIEKIRNCENIYELNIDLHEFSENQPRISKEQFRKFSDNSLFFKELYNETGLKIYDVFSRLHEAIADKYLLIHERDIEINHLINEHSQRFIFP